MNKILEIDLQKFLDGKSFNSESALRDYVVSRLPDLLGVSPSQVVVEKVTTNFEFKLSERADIVVFSKYSEHIRRALIVFEIKLDRSIQNFAHGDYEESRRKLNKYCQDLQAPYGVLLSDTKCEIFKYHKKNGKAIPQENLPSIGSIESTVTFRMFFAFVSRSQSIWYVYAIIFFAFVIYGSSWYGLKLLGF